MTRPIIERVSAREILDSRGNPTVEATVVLAGGIVGTAAAPSGASTGKYEAHEKRDGDTARYNGKGVLQAVAAVNHTIAANLCGMNAADQSAVDRALCELDGTKNKTRLGANSILAVSLATARAAAAAYRVPFYRYLGGTYATHLPVPMLNILNGGAHAANNVDVQEFMIVPTGATSFAEALRMGSEVYHALGKLLRERGLSSTVGDEGGYAPDLTSDEEALDLLVLAIRAAGYDTDRIKIALDAAASEWQSENGYHQPKRGRDLAREALVSYWEELIARYPIISLEDGLGEEDFEGWRLLTQRVGDRVMLVGDDLFVTNEARLREGIEKGAGNTVLIKPNQIGTLSETLAVIRLANEHGYRTILSHRSGETEDTTIADICVGTGTPFIKSGAPARSERVAKYNRLLRIEAEIAQRDTLCAFRLSDEGVQSV